MSPLIERPHVRALGLERHPPHLGPALRLRSQSLDHPGRRVVDAPYEHGRSGARDRRAERAQLARPLHERDRLRVERGAAGLVEAVVEPAGDQVEAALGEAEHEQAGVGDVEDGVAHRDLGGGRGAGLRPAGGGGGGSAARAFAVRTERRGTTSTASSPAGGSKRVASPSAHTTKPPSSAAATLSGWPSSWVAIRSTSASSSKIESAASSPAT